MIIVATATALVIIAVVAVVDIAIADCQLFIKPLHPPIHSRSHMIIIHLTKDVRRSRQSLLQIQFVLQQQRRCKCRQQRPAGRSAGQIGMERVQSHGGLTAEGEAQVADGLGRLAAEVAAEIAEGCGGFERGPLSLLLFWN